MQTFSRLCCCILLVTISAFTNPPKEKLSSLGVYEGYNIKDYKGYSYQSHYLDMPDGIKLATDVFLPKKSAPGEKFPTIIYFVRYVRSIELKKVLRNKEKPLTGAHVPHKEINFFTSHGYACVIVDLRGSGASFGFRKMEFSNEEVDDMNNVMNWISDQSWSDKQLATTGISYTGTTAELALSAKHPGLKACIARSNIFDLYDDMTCPGGLRQTPFIQAWKETTVALDNNDFSIFGGLAKLLVKGVNPVAGDKKRVMLAEAIEGHKKNFDIFSGILEVEARDDIESINQTKTDDFSIHNRIQNIIDSKVPIYRISGWYDGGNVHSAIKGFMSVPNTEKLLIGPWDHGPADQISPFNKNQKVKFSVYTEMLRYFDFHLKGIKNGIEKEAPIHYFQMGSEEFRAVDNWPLEKSKNYTFQLSDKNQLLPAEEKIISGEVAYKSDYTVASTNRSRWNSLTGLYKNGTTQYPDRQEVNKKMLLFQSAPAKENMEITGHPEADLYISADAKDGYFFVYLEDVAPDGTSTYITEGQLRAAFRKVSDKSTAPYSIVGPYHTFLGQDKELLVPNTVARLQIGFQPISYRLPKGHKLQLSIANADMNHFDLPTEKPENIKVYFSAEHPSKIILPITQK
jgi:putative CocE/NonD family hydrolase